MCIIRSGWEMYSRVTGKSTNKSYIFPWIRTLVHAVGVLPILAIIANTCTGNLGVNPIQEMTQRLGRLAIYFLLATLAVTPLTTITGWRELPRHRRTLGLYSFLYAGLHFLLFAGLDYNFNLAQIIDLISKKPFILVGTLTFALMIPLAITSFNFFVSRMKKNWKRLHWLIFPTTWIAILHFTWARKGDIFKLQGDILQPILLSILLLSLLVLRHPCARKNISRLRMKLASKTTPKI